MKHRNFWIGSVVAGSLSVAAVALTPAQESYAQQLDKNKVSYAQDLVPIFRGYCITCHEPGGQGYKASGFDLTTYEGLMSGTKFGPMIVPGDPDSSNLIVLIEGRADPSLRMPLNHKPLPVCLRQEIWTWIFQGANNN